MAPQDPQAAALLAHVVSQLESNVQFLVSQNYISHSDASTFLSKLPNVNNNSHVDPVPSVQAPAALRRGVAPPPPPPAAAAAAPARGVRAKALWGYNENKEDPNDLSFAAGDIIEIVEETNADWWMGSVHGKQALFPSSYVEKIAEKAAYRPFGAAYQGVDAPPPAASGGVNSVGLQQEAGQEQKKGKFGKFGNTMAHSAAGGVGFGAGAAIGGGLVRAIF